MRVIDAASELDAGVLREAGAAVVHGVAVTDDDALLALVSRVGTPTANGNAGQLIYDVTPEEGAGDVSKTAASFPLHTDSTFRAEPHAHIALACVAAPPAASGGGVSIVVTAAAAAAAVAHRAGPEVLDRLAEPAYPFLTQAPGRPAEVTLRSVLWQEEPDDWRVRFRGDVVAQAGGQHPLAPHHLQALHAFVGAIADAELQEETLLAPGDVLLVDNLRALHGRTEIREGSDRLLRRIKLESG